MSSKSLLAESVPPHQPQWTSFLMEKDELFLQVDSAHCAPGQFSNVFNTTKYAVGFDTLTTLRENKSEHSQWVPPLVDL